MVHRNMFHILAMNSEMSIYFLLRRNNAGFAAGVDKIAVRERGVALKRPGCKGKVFGTAYA